jgi:hypothetical protein
MRPVQSLLALEGHTATFPYSLGAWQFARLPCVNSPSGDIVLLDTGMDISAHVTLDIVRDKGYPTRLGNALNLAYVPMLSLGDVAATRFVAQVDDKEWQFSIFGWTLFRARAWTLGNGLLSSAKYLRFDNRNCCVTFGFDNFEPRSDLHWTAYPMYTHENRPWVHIPMAGGSIGLLADSGGGPRLILDRPQWDMLAPHVKVLHRASDQYPSWYGMQPVDVYTVANLEFGPIHLHNEPVWVRTGDDEGMEPSFGLGVLNNAVAVWDFHSRQFWIGS